ncbi:MAG: nitroreductase [Acidimicrobiaceae bacterium]|nr:nitroreductase [Acidimicrobiaceae bacterium]
MTRSFRPDPVPSSVLNRILDHGRRVPSAGNSQGYDFVVLEGDQTSTYWDTTLPSDHRETFRWQRLLDAPVIITVWANPTAYTKRYSRADKEATGLGRGIEAWVTPYWLVDGSFAAMTLQLAAINEGLGVLFFGMFEKASKVAKVLGVPDGYVPVGSLALGWPDDSDERLGRSAAEPRRPLEGAPDGVVHRGRW